MPIMQGFPPDEADQVTLANWRTQPYSSWAFHHVREIVPSADISNDPTDVWELPEGDPLVTDTQIQITLAETRTDALVVLHKGRVVHEMYRNGMTAEDPHILMSVSKSMLGLLAGCLNDKGLLDLEAALTDYVPELAETAYAGATVRQALDMRVGVEFSEDYLATSGPIISYRKAANWNPVEPGDSVPDLRGFQGMLTETDGPHGGRFHYVSPVTDLLAWVFERAAGKRYADLMSEHLWRPMGAEKAAYITVDRIGGARAAGGMCVTARDLARVGALMCQGGARDGKQVIPKAWLDDIVDNGDRQAWVQGDFHERFDTYNMCYRSKWYVHREERPLIHGMGIHGQFLFADPARDLSIAIFSSEAEPTSDHAFAPRMALVRLLQAAV
ncbi:serine hydrolase domain-containing protein [Falsiruegeria mediterranea]|uniref:6-aminohexanoate-dimer hydrolase n=1 Tax=Falsiruegeria mediterranea M17 TaxID=1200281 RepID=A0A2R8C5Z6_9RHOB|nr:serine hydrolase [Falsiruegeria mediterranea]SPJ27773.1 6-aminohexanoate-dimer hydrolase [Falsiruegeria mediterranea M17]